MAMRVESRLQVSYGLCQAFGIIRSLSIHFCSVFELSKVWGHWEDIACPGLWQSILRNRNLLPEVA